MTKRRLVTGLLAGGLTVGMLPGVAAASPGTCPKTIVGLTITTNMVVYGHPVAGPDSAWTWQVGEGDPVTPGQSLKTHCILR